MLPITSGGKRAVSRHPDDRVESVGHRARECPRSDVLGVATIYRNLERLGALGDWIVERALGGRDDYWERRKPRARHHMIKHRTPRQRHERLPRQPTGIHARENERGGTHSQLALTWARSHSATYQSQ